MADLNNSDLFGDKFHTNEKKHRQSRNTEPCAHCAKPVRIDRPHWTVEFDGQGFYAIGPECRKLFPDAERVGAVTWL